MRRLWIGLGGAVVALVALAAAAPFLLPVETWKRQLVDRVRAETGRELAVSGEFSLSLWPALALEAEGVTFSDLAESGRPEMVSIRRLEFELRLRPLLSGEIAVDRMVLVEPVVRLEIDAEGRGNWDLGGGGGGAQPAGPGLASLGDLRLEDGRLSWRDARSGASGELSDIDAAVTAPGGGGAATVEGAAVWNGERVTVTVEAGGLRELLAGGGAPLRLTLEAAPAVVRFDGTASAAEGRAAGALEVSGPSARRLAEWAGAPLPEGGTGFGAFRVAGALEATAARVALTGATLTLDETTATGELAAEPGGERPRVTGRLEAGAVDLAAYLPPSSGGSAPGWREAEVEFGPLGAVDAELRLTLAGLRAGGMAFGRTVAEVALDAGRLTVAVPETTLHGGEGTGRLEVDASAEPPAIRAEASLTGFRARPLLTAAAGFDRLDGAGRMRVSLATAGRSEREWVEALGGDGSVRLTDGTIRGIDLAAMALNLQSAFRTVGTMGGGNTDFSEMSGSFRIQNGVLRNNDFLLLSRLLRLRGAGTVNLPRRTLSYRLEPDAVAAIPGPAGLLGSTGVAVPVIVEGPWSSPSFRPDLAAAVTGIVTAPGSVLQGVGQGVGSVIRAPADALRRVAPGGSSNGGGGEAPSIRRTLRGIFGE